MNLTPHMIYCLNSRYRTMIKTSKKENVAIESDWYDFNIFVKDVKDDFIKLYNMRPKRMFLARIIKNKGYIRANLIWTNSNSATRQKTRVYILNGNYATIKDIYLRFGWNKTSTNFFMRKHTVEEVNEIINSDNPNKLFDKRVKSHSINILYCEKICSSPELIRFFKSKGVKLSRQLLHQKIIKKRKELNLTNYEPIPLTTKEILSYRKGGFKMSNSILTEALEKFQKTF